ncbi:hypothetical protein DHEL01_v202421 [Diaporthe helianthi]|uniref:Heterokaryon incompatibility domain-containing protein n=1 Tax=Diaporthe helianthi TaxID=158607 RepID=A0A2P5I9M6_DIAHE|nr:hypothetical protein DHEL01_v202421 [Diaporthe helianthi]
MQVEHVGVQWDTAQKPATPEFVTSLNRRIRENVSRQKMSSDLSQTSAQGHKDCRLSYQYQTLDRQGKEIRVLEVLPGSRKEPLRARFVSAFLAEEQTASYETISYAWGDSKFRGEIEIDESIIDIPASSAAALRCMRRTDVGRRLWIDAVCIRQDDDHERSFQVQMMGEIYSRSSHNLIYLGEEEASTKSAIASIERALEELNERLGPSETLRELLRRSPSPLACELDLPAIFHFFQRPWFSRVWVVQEAVFAPASTCYCGIESFIDLLSLVRASSYITCFHASSINIRRGEWSDLGFEITCSLEFCVQLRTFVDPNDYEYNKFARLNGDGSIVSSNLHEFLSLGDDRLCTDPRDKIFSIVGLIEQAAAKTQGEYEEDRVLLEVDYGKSLKDVLRDATRFCIQESRTLKVWYGSLKRHNSGDENDDIPLDGFFPRWKEYKASAGLRVRRETAMAMTVDPNVLTLDGYAVTEVVEVSQPLGLHLSDPDARLADTLTYIYHMCHGVIPRDAAKSNGFPECLARTFTMSPYRGVYSNDSIRSSMQKHVYSVFDSRVQNNESEYWSEGAKFALALACYDRRVFTGSNGYIGSGPSCLRTGDRIVVLLGGNVPYAVRPLPGGDGGSGERYYLLGEVYVYGAMYGEIVEAARDDGKETSVFHFV